MSIKKYREIYHRCKRLTSETNFPPKVGSRPPRGSSQAGAQSSSLLQGPEANKISSSLQPLAKAKNAAVRTAGKAARDAEGPWTKLPEPHASSSSASKGFHVWGKVTQECLVLGLSKKTCVFYTSSTTQLSLICNTLVGNSFRILSLTKT